MPAISQDRYMVQAGWDDVPHLSEETKAGLLRSTPPYMREARSQGTPSLGAGAIYPVEHDDIKVAPFQIPAFWPRSYGLDVGWNKTAAVWLAKDPSTGIFYIYAEHYRGQAEPSIHAAAIKARGDWIKGVIDPAANGRSQKDGEQLLALYLANGLKITPSLNGVETGLYDVWELLSTGRLKVFSTCSNWFAEARIYRRDEHGKIVKKFDHLMDATRYVIVSGRDVMSVKPFTSSISAARDVGDASVGY